MNIKDEVEKKFREMIDNSDMPQVISDFGELSYKYYKDNGEQEYIRGLFEQRLGFYFSFKIDSMSMLVKGGLSGNYRDHLMCYFYNSVKNRIESKLKPLCSDLLTATLRNHFEQNLIKTYGILREIPTNNDIGLFFAGGSYPIFWGKEMNVVRFVNSKAYRNTFVNDVLLSIMGHCEAHEMGIC